MSILKQLSGHPEWIGLVKAAQKMRPDLPSWDAANDNTDEWKRKSAMQEGFDLAFQIFSDLKPK